MTELLKEYLKIKKIKDQLQVGSIWYSTRNNRYYSIKEVNVPRNMIRCEIIGERINSRISFNLKVYLQAIEDQFLILQ